MAIAPTPWRARVEGQIVADLVDGWTAARTAVDVARDSRRLDGLDWLPARVPGTAAGVLRDSGRTWDANLDGEDWWFRATFQAAPLADGEEVVLCFGGVATTADVHLNGQLIATIESMFLPLAIDVGDRLQAINEIAIRCRALDPQVLSPRRPRARWRTRLVANGGLRWFRTTILGRAPGFAAGPAPVGPWRPVWLERRRRVVVEALDLRPRLDGPVGVLSVAMRLRPLAGVAVTSAEVEVTSPSGRRRGSMAVDQDGDMAIVHGILRLPDVDRWWPHTHGTPTLHDVHLSLGSSDGQIAIAAGRVGFRTLAMGADDAHRPEVDGLAPHLNGVAVLVRGAIWTPVDPVGLDAQPEATRRTLVAARDAGMNMIRIAGTGVYEGAAFHDLCDELGILVWQDLLFANLDYPLADESFRRLAVREVGEVLRLLAGRPSLAVLCGNSEIEQQVAMLGLTPDLGRDPFFEAAVPELLRIADCDATYVRSAPSGGDLPFRVDTGVANYFGVGAYRRPLSDARLAGVRFAAECLAFANVPEPAMIDRILADSPGPLALNDRRWKAGVPHDVGADWDFDDVRDHYFRVLFGLEPENLRTNDPTRYLDLSRSVSGEVMAEVFGEWRRHDSGCGGGLVLWLRDLVAGAGWGILDSTGEPKVAYHHLRRALAPTAVWMTDEGLNGVSTHVANDGPAPLDARLRVAAYRNGEQPIAVGSEVLRVTPHGWYRRDLEALIGRFIDASAAYRFGPPEHDVIVASLERDGPAGFELVSQAFRFPSGRPAGREAADVMGLQATVGVGSDGVPRLKVTSRRLAYGVRVLIPGFRPADDAFSVEPGGGRLVDLLPESPDSILVDGLLTALNADGSVPIHMLD